eukprot:4606916-Amphidinium_carterae.1
MDIFINFLRYCSHNGTIHCTFECWRATLRAFADLLYTASHRYKPNAAKHGYRQHLPGIFPTRASHHD